MADESYPRVCEGGCKMMDEWRTANPPAALAQPGQADALGEE